LNSFLSYFLANPSGFIALVDTFDWPTSGLPNYFLVASIAADLEFENYGLRLDSGDLLGDSLKCREMMKQFDTKYQYTMESKSRIIVSDGINLSFLREIKERQKNSKTPVHSIDTFGVGTNLVNPKLPAVGFVMKLVQVGQRPVNKFSNNIVKMNLPYHKRVYRLNGENMFLMTKDQEDVFGKGNQFYKTNQSKSSRQEMKLRFSKLTNLKNKWFLIK
jgi:nicotinic acid phosphoribosyltransferase